MNNTNNGYDEKAFLMEAHRLNLDSPSYLLADESFARRYHHAKQKFVANSPEEAFRWFNIIKDRSGLRMIADSQGVDSALRFECERQLEFPKRSPCGEFLPIIYGIRKSSNTNESYLWADVDNSFENVVRLYEDCG